MAKVAANDGMETEWSLEDEMASNFLATQQLFVHHHHNPIPCPNADAQSVRMNAKKRGEYAVLERVPKAETRQFKAPDTLALTASMATDTSSSSSSSSSSSASSSASSSSTASASHMDVAAIVDDTAAGGTHKTRIQPPSEQSMALAIHAPPDLRPPTWHAPWKLHRVISGPLGWVRACAVDVSNEWFATGGNDNTIMIWDMATGTRRVTFTGHIHTVRGLAVSDRRPYMFSVGDDKTVKCWDLEQNKVIRSYHGHLSGVFCCALHPTLDVLFTGGRDSVCRVWDIRTKACVHVLGGHSNTVCDIVSQSLDPQVITSSMDSTIRLWDLAAGKVQTVLTNHKKSVRAMVLHPEEFTFASGSPDNIKKWQLPKGKFLQNFSGHRAIVNTLALNNENVLFSGADNGSMLFWDWKSGYNFQQMETTVQPGSLESEAGIFKAVFDRTGTRLITCEADKTIKMWREDEEATPETHPIKWKPSLKRSKW
eukprot:TRINITY_DN4604_c0_g1_i1.p1 TRINITY_DN4604_c0_g1~~TRINITY_DN4604_c0_g1_i1.p1  ORF type:complete len:511 (-),score=133.16 TRINITY_DN4604_c0_g1_i1:228-1673(-)